MHDLFCYFTWLQNSAADADAKLTYDKFHYKLIKLTIPLSYALFHTVKILHEVDNINGTIVA